MADQKEIMNIIAYHGWACDRDDWKAWKEVLPSEYTFELWDRGYFGNKREITRTNIDIVITHSMGLLQVPDTILSQAKVLIALHPFAFFPSTVPELAERVVQQIHQMIKNMTVRPSDQIHFFRRQAGLEDRSFEQDHLDIPLLIADLNRLKTEMINFDLIRSIPKVLWVHEDQDSIIPIQSRLELEKEFPNHNHFLEGRGSHSYCLKHPETIISRLFRNESN